MLLISGCGTNGSDTSSVPEPSVSATASVRGDAAKVQAASLVLFAQQAESIIAAAAEISAAAKVPLGAEQLNVAVSAAGAEAKFNWQVISDSKGDILAMYLPDLGVCGIIVDSGWVQAPPVADLVAAIICAGPETGGE